jgi:hypothetical protein
MFLCYKSLTKTIYHELIIVYHRRHSYHRLGIWVFPCFGRRTNSHIAGYRNHRNNTWIIAQANSSLILQTVLKID